MAIETNDYPTTPGGQTIYIPEVKTLDGLFGKAEEYDAENGEKTNGRTVFYACVGTAHGVQRPESIPTSLRLSDPAAAVTELIETMMHIVPDDHLYVNLIVFEDHCTVYLKYNSIIGSRLLSCVSTESLVELLEA